MLSSSVHLPLCLRACELTGLTRVLRQGGEEEWEVLAVLPEVSGTGCLLRASLSDVVPSTWWASSKKSGSRNLTLDMQHEGWEKQTRQHILLSGKAGAFSFPCIEAGGK